MEPDEKTARAMLAQTKYADELMRKPHVVGVGIGYARKDGQATDDVALVVMVDQKVPPDQLAPEDQVPTMLDGVRVDVQEIGTPVAF